MFQKFHGQLFVKKFPKFNSLVWYLPETLHYVFKMNTRKLQIDILTLGPEESRTTSSTSSPSPPMCLPGPKLTKDPLDF